MSWQRTTLSLDSRRYRVQWQRAVEAPLDAPRLVVVSYQPNALATRIVSICLRALQRYTTVPHELWVVDNHSPVEHAGWLRDFPGINLVLNCTEPLPPEGRTWKEFIGRGPKQNQWGSYANAVGLEIAARLIDPDSAWMMSLHQDVAPCREGWLGFLMSKLGDRTRASGVRMDTVRTPEGVLHVLGLLLDFQAFKRLGLSFYPQLPQYDVGDRITVEFRKAGLDVFACRNTYTEKGLVARLPEDSVYHDLQVDRVFDDDWHVIFLNFGRGLAKTVGRHNSGAQPNEWFRFAEEYLLADDTKGVSGGGP